MPTRTSRSLAVIFVTVAIICIRLGFWQLDRLHQRRASNAIAAARRSLAAAVLPRDPGIPDSALTNRRVTMVGRFDHDREIVIRNQVLGGVPGVYTLTPLVLAATDTAVLVNRGFVPAPDGVTVIQLDSLREPGIVQVQGIALPIDSSNKGRPITHRGRTTWGRLDLRALRDSMPYPLLGLYVRRDPTPENATAFPRALPAPSLDDGAHLSYALQWFGFAAIATVFAGIMWRKERRDTTGISASS